MNARSESVSILTKAYTPRECKHAYKWAYTSSRRQASCAVLNVVAESVRMLTEPLQRGRCKPPLLLLLQITEQCASVGPVSMLDNAAIRRYAAHGGGG